MREKENKTFLSAGGRKKSLRAFQLVPDSGLQCHIPRLTPAPRAARRWALPPSHFLERWEAGLPPVHFCGRNSHLSTAEHTTRVAATPLRPRHRCEAHTNPHHRVSDGATGGFQARHPLFCRHHCAHAPNRASGTLVEELWMGVVETAALQWFRVACPGALQRLGRHNWEIRVRISTRTRSKGSPKMATCVFRPR